MTTPKECLECGALPRDADARHCAYCGALLPTTPRASASTPPAAAETNRQKLERLSHLPQWAAARAHVPDMSQFVAWSFLGPGCLIGFALVTGFMAFTAATGTAVGFSGGGSIGAFGIPFVLVPAAMCVFGIYGALSMWKQSSALREGRVVPRAGVVVARRTSRSSERSKEHLTIEFEDGTRQESLVTPQVAGHTAVGDAGWAFFAGRYLVDFVRVEDGK